MSPALSYGHAKLLAADVSKVSWTYLSQSKHCTHHHQAKGHSVVSHWMWWSRALPSAPNPPASFCHYSFWSKPMEFLVATKWLPSFWACVLGHVSQSLCWLTGGVILFGPQSPSLRPITFTITWFSCTSGSMPLWGHFRQEVQQQTLAFYLHPKKCLWMRSQHLDETEAVILFESKFD